MDKDNCYLPQKIGQITIILVHIPGPDNTQEDEHVAACYNRVISRSTDQAVFMQGDFN